METRRLILTQEEEQVIAMVATGWDNQTIADHLCIEYQSLANKLRRIYKKLGFTGRRGDKRVMVTNWYERYRGNQG
jgi:DNA-binding NarL/FixJ family response regulator